MKTVTKIQEISRNFLTYYQEILVLITISCLVLKSIFNFLFWSCLDSKPRQDFLNFLMKHDTLNHYSMIHWIILTIFNTNFSYLQNIKDL